MEPPPRPPPHGNGGKDRGGLPDGNYDIFIIPPHSAGSGFLYLPSLQPHRNSFLAGVGCTLFAVAIWFIVFPVLREWLSTIVASGGMGVILLMVGMGVAGWAWGKTQMEENTGPGGNAGASSTGPMPGAPPPNANSAGSGEPPPRPKPTWTRSTPAPGSGAAGGAKTAWEKAREETRKKEEERKKAEEQKKKREDEEKERTKQREREAREREIRELREAREKREREAKAAREADERARAAKERMGSRPSSPTKGRHQQPTAKTEAEEDAYSYRPYDKPKAPKSSGTSSMYSSSYAPSQSTARSTPPPSHRGPYHTKDPDKIVLKAVYSFNNTFMKLPIAQLVSGVGAVTDGLVLRITTEGLFIDDDVRGVPQREWDVKAWTMKLVEVSTSLYFRSIIAVPAHPY